MESTPLFFFLFFFSLMMMTVESKEKAAIISSIDPSSYYNLCSNYSCGNISLRYPFGLQSFCGYPGLKTTCVDNDHIVLYNNYVPQADPSRIIGNLTSDDAAITVRVALESLFGCGKVTWKNFANHSSIFSLSGVYEVGLHLNCTRPPTSASPGSLHPSSCLECPDRDHQAAGYNYDISNVCFYTTDFNSYPECEKFIVLFNTDGREVNAFNVSAVKDLRGFLRSWGYTLRYAKSNSCRSCETTGGRCGSRPRSINNGDNYFVCFCPSEVHRFNCSDGMIEDLQTWLPRDGNHKISKGVIAVISVSASLLALIVIATTIVLRVILTRKTIKVVDDENGGHDEFHREEAIHANALIDRISPTRYTYSQIKKFTSNFSVKLGEGGFGTVYKGFIEGTGLVAVKLLKKSAQKEKQFMNEVATVGRVHHHNLVGLLGYCAQRSTKALVYEFMEKGSLNKWYILDRKKEAEQGSIEEEKEGMLSLTSRQMFNIAVETARGILYLHQGCRNKILHLDIKPHNVLIDSKLSAKVSDFGLARLIDEDCSHLSITHAQGTPGYAAPEMWSKAYGPITDKSDVYSYGMLLLDIAGRRKKNGTSFREYESNSLFYFPEWISMKAVKRELNRKTMIDQEMKVKEGQEDEEEDGKEEDEIWEKMCMVGLWCIQHVPSNRPNMRKVIQMLEGMNNEIEMPPNPFPEGFNGDDFISHHISSGASHIQS
ncbi:hypothetical protein H6P81_001812 [Aristolochia fimbriata]|uniref:Protein kinase domain-containing protein n=1 Tax=Aristolochia fimbriata TaxID=158543 RepID=A0AAV7F8M3_ARIFI|nr:hypothetical protein H6P81_001812 [Aristolochia fimbriata]